MCLEGTECAFPEPLRLRQPASGPHPGLTRKGTPHPELRAMAAMAMRNGIEDSGPEARLGQSADLQLSWLQKVYDVD